MADKVLRQVENFKEGESKYMLDLLISYEVHNQIELDEKPKVWQIS